MTQSNIIHIQSPHHHHSSEVGRISLCAGFLAHDEVSDLYEQAEFY